MPQHNGHEPLFVRWRFGGGWVVNHRNPVGLALIIALLTGVLLLLFTL